MNDSTLMIWNLRWTYYEGVWWEIKISFRSIVKTSCMFGHMNENGWRASGRGLIAIMECSPVFSIVPCPNSLRFSFDPHFHMQSIVPSPHTSFPLPQTNSNFSNLKTFFFLDSDSTSQPAISLLFITLQFNKGSIHFPHFLSSSAAHQLSALWFLPHHSREKRSPVSPIIRILIWL